MDLSQKSIEDLEKQFYQYQYSFANLLKEEIYYFLRYIKAHDRIGTLRIATFAGMVMEDVVEIPNLPNQNQKFYTNGYKIWVQGRGVGDRYRLVVVCNRHNLEERSGEFYLVNPEEFVRDIVFHLEDGFYIHTRFVQCRKKHCSLIPIEKADLFERIEKYLKVPVRDRATKYFDDVFARP